MKIYLFLGIAFLAGGLLPIQGGINSQLSQVLKHPLQATFVSFIGGLTLITLLLIFLHPPLPELAQIGKIPCRLCHESRAKATS